MQPLAGQVFGLRDLVELLFSPHFFFLALLSPSLSLSHTLRQCDYCSFWDIENKIILCYLFVHVINYQQSLSDIYFKNLLETFLFNHKQVAKRHQKCIVQEF